MYVCKRCIYKQLHTLLSGTLLVQAHYVYKTKTKEGTSQKSRTEEQEERTEEQEEMTEERTEEQEERTEEQGERTGEQEESMPGHL